MRRRSPWSVVGAPPPPPPTWSATEEEAWAALHAEVDAKLAGLRREVGALMLWGLLWSTIVTAGMCLVTIVLLL